MTQCVLTGTIGCRMTLTDFTMPLCQFDIMEADMGMPVCLLRNRDRDSGLSPLSSFLILCVIQIMLLRPYPVPILLPILI